LQFSQVYTSLTLNPIVMLEKTQNALFYDDNGGREKLDDVTFL